MIPPIEAQTGAQLHVGGINAIFEDFGDAISEKLPLFIGVVVLLSALLLMIVFRSLLVPLKAVVMNLLSIGAAFGIIVAVFQWGWGASVIGVDNTGPIISFFPIFLFAIVFGLSMDYEVFLMSRIHEEWEHRKDATEAVTRGLALTGRVITAAAAIMVTVFASFMLGEERIIKLFGLGLASAVLIDAVVIRSVLVPAIMQLFGRRAWYFPDWLGRILPRLAVEPPEAQPPSRRWASPRAEAQPVEDLGEVAPQGRRRRAVHVGERFEGAAALAEDQLLVAHRPGRARIAQKARGPSSSSKRRGRGGKLCRRCRRSFAETATSWIVSSASPGRIASIAALGSRPQLPPPPTRMPKLPSETISRGSSRRGTSRARDRCQPSGTVSEKP